MAKRSVLDTIGSRCRPRKRRCLLAVISTCAIMAPAALQAATATAAPLAGTADRAVGSAGPAFTCSVPTIFLAQSSPTKLYDSLYGAGKATFSGIGKSHGWDYNAVGYDATDKYLYGVSLPTGNKAYPGGHLVQIGRSGEIADLGAVSGDAYLSRNGVNNGAFDNSGRFWVGDPADNTLDEVSLTTPPKVERAVALKGSWAPSDFTFADGYLWGIASDGTAVKVYRLDLSSGRVASFSAPKGIASAKDFGAAWTYGNGNLGFDANSTGALYQVSVAKASSSAPALALVSTYSGPMANNNDGAACVPTPANLSITATGPASATVGSGLSWKLTVKNLGPGISSGYVIDDSPPTGVTAVASSSPGCHVARSAVTCDEGELKVGQSASYTVEGDAPSTGNVCVTDTSTLTGNESDPNLKNNTASVKTCTLRASPSLAEQTPAPAAGTVGGSFSDSVILAGGYEPTGTVTFDLYDTGTCVGTPSYSTTTTVKGGDGSYSAAPVTLAIVGTYYWQARYSGDDANTAPATTPCASGKAEVAQAVPTLSEAPAPGSAVVGSAFADSVTLSDGYDPTGTITFDLYGNQTCTGTPAHSETATVSGNDTYTSPSTTITTVGTYSWQAFYSGDAGNQAPAATACGDGAVSVTKATPTLGAETPTPASAVVGTSFADGVTLAGGYGPSGTITFDLYSNDTCSGTPAYGSTVTVKGDGAYEATSTTVTAVGTYYWQASYSGDAANTAAAATACGDGQATVTQAGPAFSSETPTPSSAAVGSGFGDEATLSSGYGPSGTMTFDLYSNNTCSGTPRDTDNVAVSGNGTYKSSSSTPTTVGAYWWQANYSGDANNEATSTTCADGKFSVVKASPALGGEGPNPTSAVVGSSFGDGVTISAGYSPTGTITFGLYGNSACSGTPVTSLTASVDGNGSATSSSDTTVSTAGSYWWQASYGGDSRNNTASTPCADGSFSVTQAAPLLSSEVPTPSSLAAGAPEIDYVNLAGGYDPTGTVTFDLYESSTCTGTIVATDTSDIDGDQDSIASSQTVPPGVRDYWWQVSYSGDTDNVAASTPCTDGAVSVTKASPGLTSQNSLPTEAPVGNTFSDSILLSGGYSATGSIEFNLYTYAICTGTPAYSATASVDGPGVYGVSITITQASVYTWTEVYSGDGNNNGYTYDLGCYSPDLITADRFAPTLAQSPIPAATYLWFDEVTVSGGYSPSGTLTVDLYEGSSCTGTPVSSQPISIDGNGTYLTPAPFAAVNSDYYTFGVSYAGDGNNEPVSTCTGGTFYNYT
ncbi:MAG: DUF6923 family protein [Acidimicrobiales bacterium]